MASAELDEAVAAEDWGELLTAIEAYDDPAEAVRHVEPAITG